MVEAASTNAVRNYIARRGADRRPVPDRPASNGVRPQGGDSAAPSASEPANPSGECVAPDPEFIQACARDAGRLQLWIELCKMNPLTCEARE